MNLLQMAMAAQECEALFAEKNYLTTEQLEDLLDMKGDIRIRLEQKVDGCISFRRFMESRIELLKKREEEFYNARKVAERTLARFNEYLTYTLKSNPEVSFKGNDGTLHLQKSAASLQLDIHSIPQTFAATIPEGLLEKVPEEYVEKITVYKLKKNEIKADVAEGKKLSWARLEQGDHVRVRV